MAVEKDRRFILTRFEKLSNLVGIGEGGYGMVYRADHQDLGTVAYKEVEVRSNESDIKELELNRLMTEAFIQSNLDHPNVLRMCGLIFQPGHYGLVLDFIEAGDMGQYLCNNNVGWTVKVGFMRDIASGMNYLHGQHPPIIHGDLKMKNVLVSSNGTAKICDFGFSHFKEFANSKSANKVRTGTVTHVPPEYWDNPYLRKVEQFDVYGFGILMWEMMTERRPFSEASGNAGIISGWVSHGQRPDEAAIPEKFPSKIKQLMKKCWHQEPKGRPTFSAIEERLTQVHRQTSNEDCIKLVRRIELSEDSHKVTGLTSFEGRIYVVCLKATRVYVIRDLKPSAHIKEIKLPEMKEPRDMEACAVSRTIFISDFDSRCLWTIQMPSKEIGRWGDLDGGPLRLSITRANELLVLVKRGRDYHLDIYTPPSAIRTRSVRLPTEWSVFHAVQSHNGNFVISHKRKNTSDVFQISELDSTDGSIIRTFDPRSVETIELATWWPFYLGVDDEDQLIVVDSSYQGHRVLSMGSQWTDPRVMLDKGRHQIEWPMRLCYAGERHQLIVGQGWLGSVGSVSVFNLPS